MRNTCPIDHSGIVSSDTVTKVALGFESTGKYNFGELRNQLDFDALLQVADSNESRESVIKSIDTWVTDAYRRIKKPSGNENIQANHHASFLKFVKYEMLKRALYEEAEVFVSFLKKADFEKRFVKLWLESSHTKTFTVELNRFLASLHDFINYFVKTTSSKQCKNRHIIDHFTEYATRANYVFNQMADSTSSASNIFQVGFFTAMDQIVGATYAVGEVKETAEFETHVLLTPEDIMTIRKMLKGISSKHINLLDATEPGMVEISLGGAAKEEKPDLLQEMDAQAAERSAKYREDQFLTYGCIMNHIRVDGKSVIWHLLNALLPHVDIQEP